LYVSPDISEIVKFPFEVEEKISVGNTFELRELLYLEETLMPYYVLTINGKKVRLFSGQYDKLKEIKDKNFPADFYDDHIYSRPSLGSSHGYSLKATEKDKSIVKENRFMAHLKKTDDKLAEYTANRTPFIICGTPKDLGYFLKVYSNHINIAGKITGDYTHGNMDVLSTKAFKKISSYIGREQNKLIKQVHESVGKKLAVAGLKEVWKAAMAGRGLTLLVEKDFHNPGYVKMNSTELFMRPPAEKAERLNDVTERIINEVLATRGKVVIVENGKLDAFDKIALLLRY
jgi:stalled ribosome rescue protein Dom34